MGGSTIARAGEGCSKFSGVTSCPGLSVAPGRGGEGGDRTPGGHGRTQKLRFLHRPLSVHPSFDRLQTVVYMAL